MSKPFTTLKSLLRVEKQKNTKQTISNRRKKGILGKEREETEVGRWVRVKVQFRLPRISLDSVSGS